MGYLKTEMVHAPIEDEVRYGYKRLGSMYKDCYHRCFSQLLLVSILKRIFSPSFLFSNNVCTITFCSTFSSKCNEDSLSGDIKVMYAISDTFYVFDLSVKRFCFGIVYVIEIASKYFSFVFAERFGKPFHLRNRNSTDASYKTIKCMFHIVKCFKGSVLPYVVELKCHVCKTKLCVLCVANAKRVGNEFFLGFISRSTYVTKPSASISNKLVCHTFDTSAATCSFLQLTSRLCEVFTSIFCNVGIFHIATEMPYSHFVREGDAVVEGLYCITIFAIDDVEYTGVFCIVCYCPKDGVASAIVFTLGIGMDLIHQQTSFKTNLFDMNCLYELLYSSKAYLYTLADTQDRYRVLNPSKYMFFKFKCDRRTYARCKGDVFAYCASTLLTVASRYKDIKQISCFCMIVSNLSYIGSVPNHCPLAPWAYALCLFDAYVELMKTYRAITFIYSNITGKSQIFWLKATHEITHALKPAIAVAQKPGHVDRSSVHPASKQRIASNSTVITSVRDGLPHTILSSAQSSISCGALISLGSVPSTYKPSSTDGSVCLQYASFLFVLAFLVFIGNSYSAKDTGAKRGVLSVSTTQHSLPYTRCADISVPLAYRLLYTHRRHTDSSLWELAS